MSESGRFKGSRFNVIKHSGHDGLIAYNSRSGACFFVANADANLVTPYFGNTTLDAPLDPFGAFLHEHGYLVPEQLDELLDYETEYFTSRYRTDTGELTLLPTEDCNFDCLYCSQKKHPGQMLPWVRDAVRKYVGKNIRYWKNLRIVWFGGEPLLAFDVIAELAPFFQATANDSGVKFFSHITTNGYLLTPQTSADLLAWGVNDYQITVDGTPDEHNKRRRLKDGSGTFDQIINNPVVMSKYSTDFHVRLRLNYDRDNYQCVREYSTIILERLAGDGRFQLAFERIGKWGGPNDDQIHRVPLGEVLSFRQKLTRAAKDAGLPSEGKILGPRGTCYAVRPHSFTVDPLGRLMKCTNALGALASNVVGQLSSDGDLILDHAQHRRWITPAFLNDGVCSNCFYLPACQGGFCMIPRLQDGRPRNCPEEKAHIAGILTDLLSDRRHTAEKRRFLLGRHPAQSLGHCVQIEGEMSHASDAK